MVCKLVLEHNHNYTLYNHGFPISCEKTNKYILQLFAIYLMEQVYGRTRNERVDDFIVLLSISVSPYHSHRDYNLYCKQNNLEIEPVDSTYIESLDEEDIEDIVSNYGDDLFPLDFYFLFSVFMCNNLTKMMPEDAKILVKILQNALDIEEKLKRDPSYTKTSVIKNGFKLTQSVSEVSEDTKINFHDTIHLLNESVCRDISINFL